MNETKKDSFKYVSVHINMNTEFTAEFFDNSSKQWRQNKKKIGRLFYYRCCYVHTKTGRRCTSTITKPVALDDGFLDETSKRYNRSEIFCYQHRHRKGIYEWT